MASVFKLLWNQINPIFILIRENSVTATVIVEFEKWLKTKSKVKSMILLLIKMYLHKYKLI